MRFTPAVQVYPWRLLWFLQKMYICSHRIPDIGSNECIFDAGFWAKIWLDGIRFLGRKSGKRGADLVQE